MQTQVGIVASNVTSWREHRDIGHKGVEKRGLGRVTAVSWEAV
jgi:hypothetical protein